MIIFYNSVLLPGEGESTLHTRKWHLMHLILMPRVSCTVLSHFYLPLSSHTRSAAPERDAEACWHALRAGMKGAAAEAATADA